MRWRTRASAKWLREVAVVCWLCLRLQLDGATDVCARACVLHLDVCSSSLFSVQTDEAAVPSASLRGSSSALFPSSLGSFPEVPLTPVSRQLKMSADAKIS